MLQSENAIKLRRYIEDIDTNGRIDVLADYVHADVVLPKDTLPFGRQGLEGLREHFTFMREKMRYQATILDMVVGGDKIAARVEFRGTLISEFMGLPANGTEFVVDEFLFAAFRDGKVAQFWRIVDLVSLLNQFKAA